MCSRTIEAPSDVVYTLKLSDRIICNPALSPVHDFWGMTPTSVATNWVKFPTYPTFRKHFDPSSIPTRSNLRLRLLSPHCNLPWLLQNECVRSKAIAYMAAQNRPHTLCTSSATPLSPQHSKSPHFGSPEEDSSTGCPTPQSTTPPNPRSACGRSNPSYWSAKIR